MTSINMCAYIYKCALTITFNLVSNLYLQYRYARPLDYILLICGIVLGITQGALNSTSPIIFKGLSDALIVGQSQWTNGTFDYDEFYDGAMHAIYMYVGFGLGIFALAFVAVSTGVL